MPQSTPIFKPETITFLKTKFKKDATVLDVGAGIGTYHNLLGDYFNTMDAVEVFKPYIVDYKLEEKYRKVYNTNVLDFEFDFYDIIILGDVLEHISEEDGIKLVQKLYTRCNELIICIPFNSEQGIHFDNVHEIHLQSKLTNESFLEKYKGFRPLGLRYDYGVYIKNNHLNRKVPVAYDSYTEDKISHYDENLKPVMHVKKDLTIVTGLWNIGRPGRSFDQYIENFKKILETDANFFIYIPQELEHIVWEKRGKHNTYVKIYELDQIKNDIYSPHWNKTQEIRTNPKWSNQVGWLSQSPQATLEWYNPIVQSKMFFVHSASIWNPFNTQYFIWLDAGITNTVYEKFFTENKALDKIQPFLESFLFLSYPYQAEKEIHGFDFAAMNRYANKKVEYVCRGGLFGGHKNIINDANSLYYSLLQKTLNDGYMGTEESIFTLMSYLEPEKYRRYALDSNGLIVKFIQALIADKAELEPIPVKRERLKPKNLDTSKLKTSLYMLTFNFPEQVRYTLETYKKHSGWLDNTKKFLVDNSTNQEILAENKKVCEEYGFTHLPTGNNIGINRGRQFVAEHFDKTDSDYYIFLEDDMGIHPPAISFCRCGFKTYIPNLYNLIHKIMLKEEYDFLKLSFTEVYMDNYVQCSWYNVPQAVRTEIWPDYDKLPVTGLDPNPPRTKFNRIDNMEGLCYIEGEVYYANWPMIVSRKGNKKMFLDTTWAFPYEQTWMSYMFQETRKGNLRPAVLLASPINHVRIKHYSPEERKEN